MKHRIKNIGFSLVTMALIISFAEMILSLTGIAESSYKKRQTISPILMRDPVLSWVLKPDLNVICGDVMVTTGKSGFRGGEPRVGDYRRVLCIGDSVTFGWGVEENESFPAQLQSILDLKQLDIWDVINAGVPGHSSHQGRLRLNGLLKTLAPDVVVLCYGINDRFPAMQTDNECWKNISVIHSKMISHSRTLKLLSSLQMASPRIRVETNETNAVTHRVTVDQLESNLACMISRIIAAGADAILVSEYVNNLETDKDSYHKTIATVAETFNIPMIDCVALLKSLDIHASTSAYSNQIESMATHQSPDQIRQSEYRISIPLMSFELYGDDDGVMIDPYHPNATGYQLMAETAAELIISNH